jgi:hypothetical protein
MKNARVHSFIAYAAIAGGVLGLVLAPVMVIVKYSGRSA